MITKLFGPPGTGKTEKLLNCVMDALASGIKSNRIAYISFTRKAARTAKERAMKSFNLSPNALPYFRTIHSLAYHLLGLNEDNVVDKQDLKVIAEALGIDFAELKEDEEIGYVQRLDGDRFMFIENLLRIKKEELDKYSVSELAEIDYYQVKLFHDTYKKYKQDRGLVDFTDMLTCDIRPLDVDLLLIDEAQDLSPVQHGFIKRVFGDVPNVYIAGDDDQAIYSWGGADVKQFLNHEGEVIVLDQSYRLPLQIYAVAQSIATKISLRQPKIWRPRKDEGSVTYINSIEELDFKYGDWLLLARNGYLLNEYQRLVMEDGYFYTFNNKPSMRKSHYNAIDRWEQLRMGASLQGLEVAQCLHYVDGVDTSLLNNDKRYTFEEISKTFLLLNEPWYDALTGMEERLREYYYSAMQNGSAKEEPRIHISTIHGSKGGEADNVVLMLDISQSVWESYQENPDNEHRVFYVGVTRARNNLYIVEPRTSLYYDGI